ncbi:MAG: hypothetical protein AAF660_10925 [Pseudomonadota bacterium]
MKRQALLTLGLLAMTTSALTDDDTRSRMAVKIVSVDGDQPVNIAFSSDELDFDPLALQVGENRSFTDDQGRNILVSRDESGFTLDVDGRTIAIPGGLGDAATVDFDIDMDVDKQVVIKRSGGPDGITILSEETIDDATRQSIESVLRSAGYDTDVNFVDDTSTKQVHKVIRVERKQSQ